jgi:hypothetical protein
MCLYTSLNGMKVSIREGQAPSQMLGDLSLAVANDVIN